MSRERYALFGHPVAHSRSPGIYSTLARTCGQRINLELIDPAPGEFEQAVRSFGQEGGRGANVTLPYKLEAAELAGQLSERARHAGAVNVLRFEADGLLFGDNTDGAGLLADLVKNLEMPLQGRRILVLGAGGSARGILGPLLSANPGEVVIANRTPDRAELLAGRFASLGRVHAAPLHAPGKAFDLVVNATSCSLYNEVPAVPPNILGEHSVAYDLAYTDDTVTAFTRWALAHGAARAVDGWGMLVEQAAESWLVWFGNRPDTASLLNHA